MNLQNVAHHDCAQTHHARLDGGVKRTTIVNVIVDVLLYVEQRVHCRVGDFAVPRLVQRASPANNFAIMHDYCTNRALAFLERAIRFFERLAHE